MELLKLGSLNINGGRDRNKLAMISEFVKQVDIVFLQETHTSNDNETQWGMWWEGKYALSHGTNTSAGVAILFSKKLNVNILSVDEIVKGRALLSKVEIEGITFVLINVYAPNNGLERVVFFMELRSVIQKFDDTVCMIIGGDWNCTTNFLVDRNGEEPHNQSSMQLLKIINEFDLIDLWRSRNIGVRQYTWLKVSSNQVSGARLDRFYLGKIWNNKVMNVSILPNGFSDHHMIIFDFNLKKVVKPCYFWHFNVKLLQDIRFCEKFQFFWDDWKLKKDTFENLSLWWDVGKANIRIFCQNYTSHTTALMKTTVKSLQRDIASLEKDILINNGTVNNERLNKKKEELGIFLQEKVKGALIRSRICSIKDMDAPSAYFFNLEKKSVLQKQLCHIRCPNGSITSDPLEIRKMTIDFYSKLYCAQSCDSESIVDLLCDLPQLRDEQRNSLDEQITLQELTDAMGQLSTGKSPGVDGIPVEFYQAFWKLLGQDFNELMIDCIKRKTLPTSCCRAVLSLIPKKGDLGLLKNWRPVSLLCSDYKIFSKVLANRLKKYLHVLVHRDQSYCIPDRSIMDNLFLLRDVIDFNQSNRFDLGVLSLDQEKAFDQVDHKYLFTVLKEFGFGENFISYIKLLYSDAFVMVKAGGGLSAPIRMSRGIRQGCPLSGQLYSLVIEPFLCQLRKELTGILIPDLKSAFKVSLSAYADDVTVFIKSQDDVKVLTKIIGKYEKASSARVNWGKSEGYIIGKWEEVGLPKLPCGLHWGREGIKALGVFLGNEQFQRRNWEGLLEKVSARLSKWKWLLPQLSYRGRVLVINNLVASTLWHKMTVMEPPVELVCKIQRIIVNFFWSGAHWIHAAALYLPVHEGGQGLVDVRSRLMAYRIQTAQRLLYQKDIAWAHTARFILKSAGGLRLDKHLFIMDLGKVSLSEITPFYKSMLQAWKTVFKVDRSSEDTGQWTMEEPLLFNPMIQTRLLSAVSVSSVLKRHGIVKMRHLLNDDGWKPVEILKEMTGLKSERLVSKLIEEIWNVLPSVNRAYIERSWSMDLKDTEEEFPKIRVSPVVLEEGVEENTDSILSFDTPQLDCFESISKKAIYYSSVKVTHQVSLKRIKVSKWPVLLGPDFLVRDRWRALYKPPIEKRTADLQWRLIHGAIATDRHVAHLNPAVGSECRFCGEQEDLEHLFLKCGRLQEFFIFLKDLFKEFGEDFSDRIFIGGVKYRYSMRRMTCLLNYLLGTAKLSIWKTRKNKGEQLGITDLEMMFRKLVGGRLKIEFAYYKLVNNEMFFCNIWCFKDILCVVFEGQLFLNI